MNCHAVAKNSGFSLVEVMISTGIMLVVALAAGQTAAFLAQGQRQTAQMSNMDVLRKIVTSALRDDVGCRNTLVGKDVTVGGIRIDTGGAGGLGIRDNSNSVMLNQGTLIGSGGGALTVTSIWFLGTNPITSNVRNSSIVRVNLTKLIDGSGGTSPVTVEFPVSVIPNYDTPTTRVHNCWRGNAGDDPAMCGIFGKDGLGVFAVRDQGNGITPGFRMCDNIDLSQVPDPNGRVTAKGFCLAGNCRTDLGFQRCAPGLVLIGVCPSGEIRCCPVGASNCGVPAC